MRLLTAMILALACRIPVSSQVPPLIALTTLDSVQVKFTPAAGYAEGLSVRYSIAGATDGVTLARGTIPAADIRKDEAGLYSFAITGLHPKPWSPEEPNLYRIEIRDERDALMGAVRVGFRTFEIRDRRFYLNGRPIFLRGQPINPPGRDLPEATGRDPEFIKGYLRLMKSAHVNLIRTETQEWFDACDEVGLMTFQGNYGGIPGARDGSLPNYDECVSRYRNMILGLANHPSVVIYVLSNEDDFEQEQNREFLSRIREDIRRLDPSRPVIGNAGFGKGQPGEIYDIHHYVGYYVGNLCDWYDLSEYMALADSAGQPLTMSECVAAYTSDAGVFQTMSKQLATMIKWAGPAENQKEVALEYQAELVRQAVEIARRMRSSSTGLAGIMPFTYFLGWANAHKTDDLVLKPAFHVLKEVFQPVLISPECWKRNLYAGDPLEINLCLCNDSDVGEDLPPSYADIEVVSPEGRVIARSRVGFPATPYYSNTWVKASPVIPEDTPRGDYDVRCRLITGGKTISSNHFEVKVAPRSWVRRDGLRVWLYDPGGLTESALKCLGVTVERMTDLSSLPQNGVVVIGEEAFASGRYPDKSEILSFMERGGRVLCLRQDREKWRSDWLPADISSEQRKPYRPVTYIHPVGGNQAIFDGLRPEDLRYWNELGRAPNGTPDICPVLTPLKPASADALSNTRAWALCDQMLSGMAIAEVYHGTGSAILCQMRCVERVSHDPFASRLLGNLIAYACSPEHPGLVDLYGRTRWDLSAYRSGVVVSPVQGLLPHSKTYQHRGSSKGKLGEDHSIDGFTLLWPYKHGSYGWLEPEPDPTKEGRGVVYGYLSRPAQKFCLTVRNAGSGTADIRVLLDGVQIGEARSVSARDTETLEWIVNRKQGPVKLEMCGDQQLVLVESRFE